MNDIECRVVEIPKPMRWPKKRQTTGVEPECLMIQKNRTLDI